jgi:hypothetical protein
MSSRRPHTPSVRQVGWTGWPVSDTKRLAVWPRKPLPPSIRHPPDNLLQDHLQRTPLERPTYAAPRAGAFARHLCSKPGLSVSMSDPAISCCRGTRKGGRPGRRAPGHCRAVGRWRPSLLGRLPPRPRGEGVRRGTRSGSCAVRGRRASNSTRYFVWLGTGSASRSTGAPASAARRTCSSPPFRSRSTWLALQRAVAACASTTGAGRTGFALSR